VLHAILPLNVAVNVIACTAAATIAKLVLATPPDGAKSVAGSDVTRMVGVHTTASKHTKQAAARQQAVVRSCYHGMSVCFPF